MRVPEDDTDLGGGEALLGELVDVLLDVVGGQLEPRGHGASVGEGALGDTLAGSVHATHLERLIRKFDENGVTYRRKS